MLRELSQSTAYVYTHLGKTFEPGELARMRLLEIRAYVTLYESVLGHAVATKDEQQRLDDYLAMIRCDMAVQEKISQQRKTTMTHSMDATDREVAKFNITRVYDSLRRRNAFRAKCSCGAQLEKVMVPTTPADVVVKRLRMMGWSINEAKPPLCSTCNPKSTKARLTPEDVFKPMPAATAPTAKIIQGSGPDPKIARRVYAALDDHFDDNTRRYAKGWDDKRVAGEALCSVELVTRIRREAYGELAEPPEIVAIKEDLELLRMEFDEALKELATEFNAKRDALADSYGLRALALESRADKLVHTFKKAAG